MGSFPTGIAVINKFRRSSTAVHAQCFRTTRGINLTTSFALSGRCSSDSFGNQASAMDEKAILILVVGPTGAGKTTFVNQVTGSMYPVSRGPNLCK